MRIKRFNETSEIKTFGNTFPHELLLMEDNEIVDLISNTFESKVISSDPKWMVIESEWSHIDNDGDEFTKLQNNDLMGESFKVYFHIFKEDYSIIRGESSELIKFLNLAKSKFPKIKKSGGTEGSSMIIEGRMFPRLVYALATIPKGKDFVDVDGEYYSLNSMGCSSDIRFSKTIAYFSNLLIGSTLSQVMKLKKNYPGMSKVDALQKSIQDTINKNPDLFKHLNK
jgi:hypothetical protein